MNWIVAPEDQGQIVVTSYRCDEDYIYRQTLDRSDGELWLERVSWDDLDPDVECEPWNEAPDVPADAWEELEHQAPKRR